MKEIFLTLFLACSMAGANAQSQTINGDLSIGVDAGAVTGTGNRITFNGLQSNTDELSIYRFNRNNNESDLRVNIGDDYGSGGDRFVLGTTNWVDAKYYIHMVVGADGKVGILTESFGPERLGVNGSIRAREVKEEAIGWPDYVFEEGYKVGTLAALESYIKANKRLPEMPTAKEIETNGLVLGEVVKLQQKKIEELTLHLIEKDKEINKLKKMEAKVSELDQKLNLLLQQQNKTHK